jgi:hypothetical protein
VFISLLWLAALSNIYAQSDPEIPGVYEAWVEGSLMHSIEYCSPIRMKFSDNSYINLTQEEYTYFDCIISKGSLTEIYYPPSSNPIHHTYTIPVATFSAKKTIIDVASYGIENPIILVNNGRNDDFLRPCPTIDFDYIMERVYEKEYPFSQIEENLGSLTLYIRPILTIFKRDNTKNLISIDDEVPIDSHVGFKEGEYNWEYSLDGISSWTPMPQYDGLSSINFKIKDVLGETAEEHSGEYIYIRQAACSSDKYECTSNIIFYNIRRSAPHIQIVESEDPICADSHNGQFKVTLDRSLLPGERLIVDYENLTSPFIGNIPDPLLDENNSFHIENLGVGDYKVQISGFYTDENNSLSMYSDGLDHSMTATIESYPALSYQTVGTPVNACFNGTGSITVEASGGDGDYTLHLFKDGSEIKTETFTSSPITLDKLEPGEYKYHIIDGHNCEMKDLDNTVKTVSFTITAPSAPLEFAPLSSEDQIQPSGYNREDGTAVVGGGGGTPPYTITWTNKSTGTPLLPANIESVDDLTFGFLTKAKNIPGGTYTVEIKDANNCTFTTEITLDQPEKLEVDIEETNGIPCNGNTTGELVAHATGGVLVSGEQYSYQWYKKDAASAYQLLPSCTNSIAPNLGAGDYKVAVTDKSWISNTAEKEYTLKEPDALTTALTRQDVSCHEENNGSIQIVVSGGTGIYTLYYKASADAAYQTKASPSGGSHTFTLDNLKAGDYQVYIQDANGCYAKIAGANTATVKITQPAQAVEISSDVKQISGAGLANGSITIQVKGGTPDTSAPFYSVTWKNSSGAAVPGTESVVSGVFTSKIENLTDDEYTVEVKDKNYTGSAGACYVTSTFAIISPDPLIVELEQTGYILCNGAETGELVAHVTGGVLASGEEYTYQWYKKRCRRYLPAPPFLYSRHRD